MERAAYRLSVFEKVWLGLAAGLLGLLLRTLRFRVEGEERIAAWIAGGTRLVLLSYHSRLIVGMYRYRTLRPAIMVSESRDGERIAWLAERFGWRPIRGSSSRGAVRALLRMVREVKGGAVAVQLVDGPRGPAGTVKPGLTLMASRAGALIVPVYLNCPWRWTVPSWDRLQIPLPFARVYGRVDEPVVPPPELSEAETELLRLELEKRMAEGYRRLEAEGVE